jgi:hypothetical protein
VIVVKKLTAKLKIELAAKLRNAFLNVLGLQLDIFVIIESDFTHNATPFSVISLRFIKNINTNIIIPQILLFFNTNFEVFWGKLFTRNLFKVHKKSASE